VGYRACLDAVIKLKTPAPVGNRTPVVQPVLRLTELSRIPNRLVLCRVLIEKLILTQMVKKLGLSALHLRRPSYGSKLKDRFIFVQRIFV
jgi:hypothetical protein